MAAVDAPEVCNYELLGHPHLTSIPFTNHTLGIGTPLRQSASATLLRVARMAQGPHSGPPNQMPAPRA